MATNFFFPVYAVSITNFNEGLLTNGITAMNDLPGVPRAASGRFFIRAIECLATENFGPEFNFFSTSLGRTNIVATDTFLCRWGFTDAMGEQMGAAGPWRYYVDGLSLPYYDLDSANSQAARTLHVVLQNISATAKVVNSPFNATFWLEPAQAW